MKSGEIRSFAEKLVEKLDAAKKAATVSSGKFGSEGMNKQAKQATGLDAGWYLVRRPRLHPARRMPPLAMRRCRCS